MNPQNPNSTPLTRNAICLEPVPAEDGRLPTGASRLGGCPDLPAELDWPRREETEVPLSFLAQINFAEVHPYDRDNRLPEQGMLWLFYDCSLDGMPWGYDPADRDGKAVFYWDGDAALLEHREPPEELEEYGCRFPAAGLTFRCQEERQRLWEPEEAPEPVAEEDIPLASHKLLGWADELQDEMEPECEYVSHGLYCGDGSGYAEGQRLGLDFNCSRWELLLQLDSDDRLEMEWGDCGMLYLWIDREDLKARQFDRCWLILQCC